jgi:hypothetical protein
MAFSVIDFYKAALDIEKYLGYIKGNELCFEYLASVNKASRPSADFPEELYPPKVVDLRDWKTPCPDGQFQVRPSATYGGSTTARFQMPFNATESQIEAVKNEIKANLDTSWNNGPTWSDGIYEYVNDVSRQFVKPDVEAMAGAVHDIAANVVEELTYAINDDWAGLQYLLDDWHGQGAGAFTEFYANFNDVLARFGLMSGHVAVGLAAGTRIINGYQQAAWEFVDSVRNGLKTQLGLWVEVGGKPPAGFEFPAWIADALKIAEPIYDVLKLLPPVKAASAPLDAAITVAKSATKLIGMLPQGKESAREITFDKTTADGIYQQVTNTLHQKFFLEYDKAMQDVQSPGGGVDVDNSSDAGYSAQRVENEMLDLQGALDQWELPEVPPGSLAGSGDTYPTG